MCIRLCTVTDAGAIVVMRNESTLRSTEDQEHP